VNRTEDDLTVEDRLREAIAVHFDPSGGTPYWLEQVPHLGFDPRDRVRRIEDLGLLGPMCQDALCHRPLFDFVPRSIASSPDSLQIAQTGGTLGAPTWTAYRQDEFREAFVDPFVIAAHHVGFPTGGSWLYVGPSGPHIIGRAAEAIARATGAGPPYTVDFDPRWAGKLSAGSFASRRYLVHVVQQAIAVVEVQPITVLFTTPTILGTLAEAMSQRQREAIRGVHYGGAALTPESLLRFQCQLFPAAVHLSGYGNTLFGCCLELSVQPGREPTYFPYRNRLVFGVVSEDSPSGPSIDYERPGADGRLAFSRFDRTMLLANLLERDHGCLVEAPRGAPMGFHRCGIQSPGPRRRTRMDGFPALY
jgi:hypothetical protein